MAVRKHRAPKGALRHIVRILVATSLPVVRKHRAPKAALRHPHVPVCPVVIDASESTERQKVH